MNKLSNRSIEKFKLFLADKEFSYISLTRHEFKILFNIYNSVIPLISAAEEKENKLVRYLEDKITECNNNIEMLEGTCSHRIPLLSNRIYTYEDILEKVKSGKYE